MQSLSLNAMQFASGGEMPLVVLGAAAGAAHNLGQAFGASELSLTSLASGAVIGFAIGAIGAEQNTVHLTHQEALATISAAGIYGYIKSILVQHFNTDPGLLTNIVY